MDNAVARVEEEKEPLEVDGDVANEREACPFLVDD